jgi:hypothetical protein
MTSKVTLWELISRPPYPSAVISDPPSGSHMVTSIYVDSDKKLVIAYSDIPRGD